MTRIVPPRRGQQLVTKNQAPTARAAEFFERIANDLNIITEGVDLGGIVGEQGPQGPQGPQGIPGPPGDATVPESLSFTYNGDGTVSNIAGATTDIDFTYSGGLVSTIDDQEYIKTFGYNGSNQLVSITISAS